MQKRFEGLFHLAIIYVTWGSTFLAIRYAVQGEGAYPPFLLAGLRVGLAGLALIVYASIRRYRLRLSNQELAHLALSGCLLWFGGHALLIWAAQWADSGFGAILFATVPLWTTLLENRRAKIGFTWKTSIPITCGFIGIIILSWPQLIQSVDSPSPFASVFVTGVILVSAFCWALGSFITSDEAKKLPVSVAAGWQQLFASAACFLMAAFKAEPLVTPSSRATWALIYLIVIGSIVAFSSYMRAQQLISNKLISSFAYINPVIAVILGSLFANEIVSPIMMLGIAIVLLSVIWLLKVGFSPATTESKGR